jgi:hypothetical protein
MESVWKFQSEAEIPTEQSDRREGFEICKISQWNLSGNCFLEHGIRLEIVF